MRIPLALVVMLFGVIACNSSPTDSLSDAPADIQAFLAKVGSRVGWLPGASPVPMRRRFPVRAQHSTVFTATVFSQLKD